MSNSASNEEQIRELIMNWAAAVRKKDMAKILAHHSEDFVMYDVPPPFQSNGLDEYRKTWDLFFTGTKKGVFDIIEMKVVADENVGFAFAKMQCGDKSNSEDYVPLDFRLTVGLKKIDGQWTILHEHHSVPAGE
jgi:uncharacterized protein (TIGR02246 family)